MELPMGPAAHIDRGVVLTRAPLPRATFSELKEKRILFGWLGLRHSRPEAYLYPPTLLCSEFLDKMSSHFGRLFQKSNSSISLQCGNALESSVVRLRDKIFLLDAGLAAPVVCTEEELTRVPANRTARFNNRIGFLNVAGGNSRSAAGLSKAGLADVKMGGQLPGSKILERMFVDIVAGDQVAKGRATMRLNDMVGFNDSVPGEPQIISPYKFRQHRAWIELNKYWRRNMRVRGVVLGKVNRGYAVAISGFVAFLPQSLSRNKRIVDKFFIDDLNTKTMNFVVK